MRTIRVATLLLVACAQKSASPPPPPPRCYDEATCAARCDRGEVRACVGLGELVTDADRARDLFEQACAKSSGVACLFLIVDGAAEDPKAEALRGKVLPLLEKDCADHDPDACFWLGTALQGSVLGQADPTRGEALVGDACRQGHAEACLTIYDQPHAALLAEARAALDDRCGLGDKKGCQVLAAMHRDGIGVAKSVEQMQGYAKRACGSATCLDFLEGKK